MSTTEIEEPAEVVGNCLRGYGREAHGSYDPAMTSAVRPVALAFHSALLATMLFAGEEARPLSSPSSSLPVITAARLPTGVLLDPAAPASPLGNFPVALVLSPEKDRAVVLLSGWRQQGLQVVDLASRAVVQSLGQRSAFLGVAFSPDGSTLYASGGDDDLIHVYSWRDRQAADAGTITLRTKADPKKSGTSYPAGLAVSPDGQLLFVAENLGDSLAIVDTATRAVLQRIPAGTYPYGVLAGRHGEVYVSCWAGAVAVFRSEKGAWRRTAQLDGGRHPSAMAIDRAGRRLYVASSTTDSVAILDTASGKRLGMLQDAVVGAPQEGSTPNAMALSADERRLFVAEADANAVAVFDLVQHRLAGRIPVGWYPTAVAVSGNQVMVVNAKGAGSAPNPVMNQPDRKRPPGSRQYTYGQLDGTLMTIPADFSEAQLRGWSSRVRTANGWSRMATNASYPPFRHVLYVIKENRTYDQVLGDLGEADGDPELVYFGRAISPNHHALAERFGIYDRFFVNAEVSAQGHNWSTAAYSSDYVEKTAPSEYAGVGRSYDYEGRNRNRSVADQDDVNSPSTGYLWDLAARKGISFRDYGEFVVHDERSGHPGEQVAVKQTLKGHSNPLYPGFDLDIPDQLRADVWLHEFERFQSEATMPVLEIVRLPNDHTAGLAAGKHTPRAYMADNDLALGRIIAALSRSRYWKDTVVFVVEDDAQSGPDHVDSHRSVLLVISAWNAAGVIHRFVNTTDVLSTVEEILGLRSLSHFDYFGHALRGVFAKAPDLRPYDPLIPQVDLHEVNPSGAVSKASELLDLHAADVADDDLFNRILWKAVKGEQPYPGSMRAPNGGR